MKGKVETIQTQIQQNRKYNPTQKNMKYTLTLTVTLEQGLTYEEGEKQAAELKEKYLGKEITLEELLILKRK